jgi:hypothetical protein
MDIRAYWRAYARSPLGMGSLLLALAAGLVAAFRGVPPAFSALLAVASLAVLAVAALALGLGQKAASAELGRESEGKAESRLEEAAAARSRLAGMRLPQAEVASARDLLVLEAGSFIEGCRRARSYDPGAVEAIVGALDLVDAWLKAADEGSIERRFDVENAAPFPDAARRTAESLREKAALVAARRASVTGELSGADRIAIEEELK